MRSIDKQGLASGSTMTGSEAEESPADSLDDTEDDEYVKAPCQSAESRASREEGKSEKVEA